ncbi:MAG: hypothetical protein IPH28_19945 [Cytophagaceae bacterium]|nr:hypothetical protein [Cytophagaceae bacterium]
MVWISLITTPVIRNQILRTTLAATTGAGEILANTGTLRNKGIEIGLNTTPIKRKDFIQI